ncbi:MAG: hypothetical protein FJ149_03595 [Euryarchaeota archaeon]|nr:hypothetical protein [Euryarchaeota archaeon]
MGARDRDRRLFDGLIPLPQGTTYNCYLVRGASKTALVDTVNPGFEPEMEARIRRLVPLEDIDYVNWRPTDEDMKRVEEIGMALAAKVKGRAG